LEGGGVEQKL
jgi:hypothetical protein